MTPTDPDDRPSDRDLALDALEPVVVRPHTCTSPDPERCLFCALDAVVAEQKMFDRARAEKDAADNREWWAS